MRMLKGLDVSGTGELFVAGFSPKGWQAVAMSHPMLNTKLKWDCVRTTLRVGLITRDMNTFPGL